MSDVYRTEVLKGAHLDHFYADKGIECFLK